MYAVISRVLLQARQDPGWAVTEGLQSPRLQSPVDTFPPSEPPTTIITQTSVVTQIPGPTTTTLELTTTFTPPASCLDRTYTLSPDDDVLGHDFIARGYKSECFPTGFTNVESTFWGTSGDGGSSSQGAATITETFYSPGVRPAGYEVASASHDGVNLWETCCPSSMTLWRSVCESSMSSITYVNGTDTTTTTGGWARAPRIVVAFQDSDTSLWATPTSTSATESASTSRPTASAISPTSTPQPGLSTGAQAGIGAGVAAGVLALLLVLGLWFWKKRKQRNSSDTDHGSYDGKPELDGEGVHRELDGNGAVYEKNAVVKPVEVGNDAPVELEANWRGWEVGTGQENSRADMHG